MNYKQAWLLFRSHAAKKGFTKKVVGDEAFTDRTGKTIRLINAKGDTVTIFEEGQGRYALERKEDCK